MTTPIAAVTTTSKEAVLTTILPSPIVERGILTRNFDRNIWTKAMNIIGEKGDSYILLKS